MNQNNYEMFRHQMELAATLIMALDRVKEWADPTQKADLETKLHKILTTNYGNSSGKPTPTEQRV